MICIADTLKLSPGWEYNLNVIKNFKGTEDFLSLSDNAKGCQLESFENCTTRTYVEKLIEICGCLPLSMKFGNNDHNVSKVELCMCFSLVKS